MSAASIIIIIDELQAKLATLRAVDFATLKETAIDTIEAHLSGFVEDGIDSALAEAGVE